MNNFNVPNDSPELPDISPVDTAQSAPRATALPYSNENLASLLNSCLEDIGRCVNAAEVAAEADKLPTRAHFEIIQSRMREHRLRLDIWVSDCVAEGGSVDAITSETEPDLFAVLVIIRENIKKETETILANIQQTEREAKKGNKVTDEKGPIYEAWQNIKIACNSLTFSLYNLAELQDTVQMAIAIQCRRGPEAAIYRAIRKVGANFKDDDEFSVSSDTVDDASHVSRDDASHVSSDERCSECQSRLPWYAMPHHKNAYHDTFHSRQSCSQASSVGMTTPETSPIVPRAIPPSTRFPGGPEWQPPGTKDQDPFPDTGSRTMFGLVMSAVQSFVNIAAKVAYGSVRIGYKVVNDMNRAGTRIVADTVCTTLKVGGDFSSTADVFLKYAVNVFTAAGDTAVVDTILQMAHRSLQATTLMLSGAGLILRGILTNDINEDTLFFILNHLHDLLGFLYDLVKPGNVVPAYPGDYVIKKEPGEADEFPGGNNPYNEFDLRREQNRIAIAYQVQRVGLTFINILQMGRTTSPWRLDDLAMNVRLSSDFDANGNSPPPIYISRLEEKLESPRNEKWLFINGIANELTWFQRSCDKIRDTFKREVHGIYNRSDGILWDLIECCGERSAVKKRANELIERTQSSKAAQECLEKELTDALWPTDSSAPDKVIMIAHSQGCLILRLVLQKLVSENPVESQRMRDMKKKLRVFTFGNPSIDWLAIGEPAQSLGEYASATEHFAHEVDFVARLGIVTHSADPDSGYDADSTFYSKKGRGHLFGAHYPLAENAYINAGRSKLLSAVDGRAID